MKGDFKVPGIHILIVRIWWHLQGVNSHRSEIVISKTENVWALEDLLHKGKLSKKRRVVHESIIFQWVCVTCPSALSHAL
jgi:hypothetical protein